MLTINYADKVAEIKLVYYGPAAAGKTTSIQYLAKALEVEVADMQFRLGPEHDRGLYFEYAPLMQKYGAWSVQFHFFTLPGQLKYAGTRELVLHGAQAIVYVADSQYEAVQENLRLLVDLQENLGKEGVGLQGLPSENFERTVPIVLFYNKRDLPGIMPVEYMDATFGLDRWKVPRLCGSALTGQNVLKAADWVTSSLLRKLSVRLGLEDKDIP